MRTITERAEIAKAINGHTMPVITIDLADADEYGLKSQKVLIDNGTYSDGFPYYIRSELRAYSDERKLKFSHGVVGLSASFTYHDMKEMLEYRNAPVVKPDEDVVIAIINSNDKTAYAPIVLHTGTHIDSNCTVPLVFTDAGEFDTRPFLKLAGFGAEEDTVSMKKIINAIVHHVGCDEETAEQIFNGVCFFNNDNYSACMKNGNLEICKNGFPVHRLILM